ncbi:ABC-type nitrate/sulfonate/bicarbonate transport system, substrate-binding protein [Enhydrobacter aerosaccus]|uniref:Thiamine pyrimidine synthase n=1 Tax=Enhydrobacter aerosaccus TaxID=225324 RepID=A0A1T4RKE2_9HYPH|nr:ABC transporter substrate-binding protein [Enhydrobacter aerosaccus]SKA16452.1 ABC-type nitrate/sulfonate/bicarbonate transport system, substrate-binding protein [Enhydrobacter aerosaccus]
MPLAPAIVRAEQPRHVDLLIDWKPSPTHAGVFIARESGAFEKRGLDVRVVEGHGANIAAEMVSMGKEYWIATSSAGATAIARSNGQAVRSLAVYYRREPTVLYARASERIDAPRDLYGKKVGLVPGSMAVDEFRALLSANRLNRANIKEVEVEPGPQALLDHKVDALIDYEELAPAELQAEGHKISTLRFADYGVRLYSLNLVVNEMAWLDPARQEIARKIAEALVEGYQAVRDHPKQSAAQFGKLFPDFSARYLELSFQIVSRQLATPIGSQTRLGWEDTLKTLSSLGLLSRAVSAEEVAIYD